MLTLTRRLGESIMIGDDIEIIIKDVSKDKIRIGIIAPRDVMILRKELTDTLETNMESASNIKIDKLKTIYGYIEDMNKNY